MIAWWEAAGCLTRSAVAVMAGLVLVPPEFSRNQVEEAPRGDRAPRTGTHGDVVLARPRQSTEHEWTP